MKITTVLAVLVLAGCTTLTPTQKKVLAITGTVLVVGAIAAHNGDHQSDSTHTDITTPRNPCSVDPKVCR
jgi:hypothetical protein